MAPARLVILAAALLAAAPPAALAKDAVLVVGDSLQVGTGPHLRKELAGTEVTVDARGGRPSGEGVGVLRARLRPEHRVVVFDLGTNDSPSQPDGLAGSLAAARRLAGDRCMVVATLQRPPLNGVPVDGLNRAVEGFAQGDPRVELVDWHGAAGEPGVLNPDRVHATPQGYALRARVVSEGVQACLAGGGEQPAEPAPPPAQLDVGNAPRRPLLISWPAVERTPPVGALLSLVTGAGTAVADAGSTAIAVLAPEGPEPVLGKP